MNLTDNEIIKALGSVKDNPTPFSLTDKVMIASLDLINRQKAEVEKYDNIKTTIHKFWDILLKLSLAKRKEKPTLEEMAEAITEIEAEAIKEFWGKTKKYFKKNICFFTPEDESELVLWGDNLVKEMVGE